MSHRILLFAVLWTTCTAKFEDFYYQPSNNTRSTPVGIAAYRSALTLDWMSAEDSRQRELVSAFEQEPQFPSQIAHSDCISYGRPSAGTVAKLMLEVMRNLEGDESGLVADLVKALVRAKLLMLEITMFENEPDFDALVKTPAAMIGEPHITFPRIVEVLWMAVTDPNTVKRFGWCTISKMTAFIQATRPVDIAKYMRNTEQIISRARFIMEEFIQHVTPLNMDKSSPLSKSVNAAKPHHSPKPLPPPAMIEPVVDVNKRPVRTHACPLVYTTRDINSLEQEYSNDDHWNLRFKKSDDQDKACLAIRPNARDIGKRFYAILPYFDKDHANTPFLHKFRGTVNQMAQGVDMLDREAAFYAAILTPLVFMQHYRDSWCLIERFHRSLRLYQISHPTEKRASLKLLQNLRPVNQKIRAFLMGLSKRSASLRSTSQPDAEEEELPDRKDIRYLKELVKNLG